MIPIHDFRAYLIQKHLAVCSQCQREWAIDKSTEESFTKPEWVINEHSLWPQIRQKINAAEPEEAPFRRRKTAFHLPRWQWALAGLALLIFIVFNLMLDKGLVHSLSKKEVSLAIKIPQVRIIHAELRGKKARPFIYQTPENLFIWFDKIKQEGD
jgi:predicted anti-sigma-YlaC factor YlaD